MAADRPAAVPPRVLLAGIGAGALAVVLLGLRRAPRPVTPSLPLLAHEAGLLAGYAAPVMLLLVSRAPALERGLGSDRLTRWHARGGRTFVALVLVHAVAAWLGWAQLRRVDVVTAGGEVLHFPGLLSATVGTVALLVVAGVSVRRARARVSYERWHAVHLLTYLGVALSFSHQLVGPDTGHLVLAQVLWALLYTWAFAIVLRYRLLTPLHQVFRHRLRVVAVVPEADGVASIVLHGRHVAEMAAQPGQFFRWRFLGAGTWRSAHPFSLSAPPRGDHLRITVKQLGEGTRRLHRLPVGTRVLAEGPYGAMTERVRRRREVLLVAGGIGITPMRALFETLHGDGRDVTLLYRASRPCDVVFRRELDAIAAARGGRVVYLVGPSSDPRNGVDGPNLLRLVPSLQDHDVYLCAAPRLAAAVHAGLREAGVPRSQVHDEQFAF